MGKNQSKVLSEFLITSPHSILYEVHCLATEAHVNFLTCTVEQVDNVVQNGSKNAQNVVQFSEIVTNKVTLCHHFTPA